MFSEKRKVNLFFPSNFHYLNPGTHLSLRAAFLELPRSVYVLRRVASCWDLHQTHPFQVSPDGSWLLLHSARQMRVGMDVLQAAGGLEGGGLGEQKGHGLPAPG